MLKELTSEKFIKQNRRSFADDYFDLFVWMGRDSNITGFQLCYDKQHAERALTWKMGEGYSHERVDDGGEVPGKDRTPVLEPDGLFPVLEIIREFETRSAAIDSAVRSFVIDKLGKYALR